MAATADAATVERIHKAVRANPGARDFLGLVAEAGTRWRDRGVVRASLEALAATGDLSDGQVVTLEEAYVAAQEKSAMARDIEPVILSA